MFRHNTVLDHGYQLPYNASPQYSRDSLLYQFSETQTLLETQFTVCNNTMGNFLKYAGSTTIVRDIDFISRTLEGEDALM